MADVTAADVAAARPRRGGDRAAHADPVHAHDLRARGRHRRAQGREPPAHRLVQDPRRRGQARRARRGRLRATAWSRPRPATTRRAWPPARAARGVPCEVFVPDDAPMAKVEAARGQGATVHIGGGVGRRVPGAAQERAREGGLAFVHPFDDPDIVAGQGSLGLELLEDVPDLAKVVVPVGGGGLCARHRDRGQVGAAGRRGRRRAGRRLRALPRVAAARRAGARHLGADDRRRHRGQAPGRAHARRCCARYARRRRRSSTRTRPPRRWWC